MGFFFLLEPNPGAPLTNPRWGFFFLVLRDSELLVPVGGWGGQSWAPLVWEGGPGAQRCAPPPLPVLPPTPSTHWLWKRLNPRGRCRRRRPTAAGS